MRKAPEQVAARLVQQRRRQWPATTRSRITRRPAASSAPKRTAGKRWREIWYIFDAKFCHRYASSRTSLEPSECGDCCGDQSPATVVASHHSQLPVQHRVASMETGQPAPPPAIIRRGRLSPAAPASPPPPPPPLQSPPKTLAQVTLAPRWIRVFQNSVQTCF